MSDRPGPVEVRGAVGGETTTRSLSASLPARPDMPPAPCRLCPVCSCHTWCRTAEPVPRELLTAVGGAST